MTPTDSYIVGQLDTLRKQIYAENPRWGRKFDQAVSAEIARQQSFAAPRSGLGDNITLPIVPGSVPNPSFETAGSSGIIGILNSVGNIFSQATTSVLGPITSFYNAKATINALKAKATAPLPGTNQVAGTLGTIFSQPVVMIGVGIGLLLFLTRR